MKGTHKHAEIIKAWAEGVSVQVFEEGLWHTEESPKFLLGKEYRLGRHPQRFEVPHCHADVIKAWADGGSVEFRDPKEDAEWCPLESARFLQENDGFPLFSPLLEYRKAPEGLGTRRVLVKPICLSFDKQGRLLGASEGISSPLGAFTLAVEVCIPVSP